MTRWCSVLGFGLLLFGCEERSRPAEQLYFKELAPPVGVTVAVLDDISTNTPAGGKISVVALVDPEIDRDELTRLTRSFFQQASGRRRGFAEGRARQIEMLFYDSKEKAAMRGDNWLARVELTPPDTEPIYSNRQRVPLLRWVKEALGRQPQYSGVVKPKILVDPEAMSVEVTIPFVTYDGSGRYVDDVTFQRATTEFSSLAIALFTKLEQLKRLTFVGEHQGKPLLQVSLTRDQYRQVNLRQVEEGLGEFRGRLINMKLAGKTSDKKMQRMLSKKRRRMYREVFAILGDDNVMVSRSLR
jgi:hypothetical protein